MSVKVRCPGCEKVLAAPDSARGKAIRCPECETKIRIPGGEGGRKPARSAATSRGGTPRKRAAADDSGDDDFLGNLDLRRMEDRRVRVCPKCGTTAGEDDVECRKCHVNLETGRLSELMKKKLRRKGPDPAEFYGKAWSNSWEFLMANKGLAVKSGLYWLVFGVGMYGSLLMVPYVDGIPTKIFWLGMYALFYVGVFGWFMFLNLEVISATMNRKKRISRLNFDFFVALALGVKLVIWSVVLIHPFAWCPPVWLLPIVAFPLAMVHMAQPYTHRAWIAWDLMFIFFKNIGASLYWILIAIVAHLPAILVTGGLLILLVWKQPWMTNGSAAWLTELCGFTVGGETGPGFIEAIFRLMFFLIYTSLILAPGTIVLGFCSVFTMRANGLIGYYRKQTLDLVVEKDSSEPVGFWVRYYAFWIDLLLFPLASILLFKDKLVTVVLWLLNIILVLTSIWEWARGIRNIVAGMLFPVVNAWAYFTLQESSIDQCSVGKYSFGVQVVDKDGKRIDRMTATKRFLIRGLCVMILGSGGVMILLTGVPFFALLTTGLAAAIWAVDCIFVVFDPEKRALHDKMAHTRVVWKGDDERSG